jgi:hypothetical protein
LAASISTKERLFCYGLRMSSDGRPTKEPWWQVPWTTLRPVGNSVIVKLTILIPAVGYLIIFNDKLVGYVDLIREISNLDKSSGLSVPPRMFQLYFGLCFVAVASAIYTMACPSIIKRYPSAIDLGAATTEAVGDYGYTIVEQEVLSSEYSKHYDAIKGRFQRMGLTDEQTRFEINNALINIYFALKNSARPVWRWLCAGCFAFGFFVLFISSIKIFFRVAAVLAHVIATRGITAIF